MTISWENETQPDGSAYRQINVSDEADWGLFDRVAALLERELGGQWIEKLDGVEQRYWDLKAGEGKITLHFEEFLGIMVVPTQMAQASKASMDLLEEAYRVLSDFGASGRKGKGHAGEFLQNLKIMLFGRPK